MSWALPHQPLSWLGLEKGRKWSLFKSGQTIKTLQGVNTIVFDKTGTITEGKPQVTDIHLLSTKNREQVLQLAASSEQYSEHPLAQALLRSAEEESIPLLASQDFQALSGRGLSVTIAEQTIYLGNERLMREQGIDVSKGRAVAETFAHQAKTPVFLASQQELLAVIAIADKVKETSRQAVQALQTMELEVVMLTGDNEKLPRLLPRKSALSRWSVRSCQMTRPTKSSSYKNRARQSPW